MKPEWKIFWNEIPLITADIAILFDIRRYPIIISPLKRLTDNPEEKLSKKDIKQIKKMLGR